MQQHQSILQRSERFFCNASAVVSDGGSPLPADAQLRHTIRPLRCLTAALFSPWLCSPWDCFTMQNRVSALVACRKDDHLLLSNSHMCLT
jgi:hypothetical protein